jgi:hypothetical protein
MLLDAQLLLSDAQAVTVTANSTNVVDTAAARDPGAGESLTFVVQVTQAATAAGSATVAFSLETATDAAFTSPVQLFSSGPIAKAALTLGAKPVATAVPPDAQRFLRVVYTVATGPLLTGAFTAGLSLVGAHDEALRPPYGHGLLSGAA